MTMSALKDRKMAAAEATCHTSCESNTPSVEHSALWVREWAAVSWRNTYIFKFTLYCTSRVGRGNLVI